MKTNPPVQRTTTYTLLLVAWLLLLPQTAAATVRSCYFDGTSSVRYSNSVTPRYHTGRSMTVEAWVYREDATRSEILMTGMEQSDFLFGFQPRLFFQRGDSNWGLAHREVPTGQWTHVAASFDGDAGTVQFFIDGEPAGLESLQSDPPLPFRSGVIIGAANTSSFPSFQGRLDEIRLWRRARSQEEIANNLAIEVERNDSDLVAVWGEGGLEEACRNDTPSTITGESPTPSPFGILPRRLVIPKAADDSSMHLDGTVDLVEEYDGADQMVLRYLDGENGVRDAVAYFKRTDNHLYIGVRGARAPDPNGLTGGNRFEVYFNSTGLSEWPLSSDQKMGRFDLNGGGASYHKGAGFVWGASEPSNTWIFSARQGNPPSPPTVLGDIEFRINVTELGSWSEMDRIGIGHLANGSPDSRDAFAPDHATPLTTGCWAETVYVGESGVFPTLDLVVYLPLQSDVVLTDDLGQTVAERTINRYGLAVFDNVPFDPGRPHTVSIVLPEDYRPQPLRVFAAGLSPTEQSPTSATYPPCAGTEHWYLGSCDFANIAFRFLDPPPPVEFDELSTETSWPSIPLRTSDDARWCEPGSMTAYLIEAEHDLLDFYLVGEECPTNSTTLLECVEGVDYFRIEPPDPHEPGYLRLEIPRMVPSQYGNYHVVVHDRWRREGVDPDGPSGWIRSPLLEIGEPPFPLIHGFHFRNSAGGGSWKEMTSVYGSNMFSDLESCEVWPHYAMWFPVYQEMASRDGSCIGMSAMARMIADGRFDIKSWDREALYGSGHFTNGLEPGGMFHLPPAPDKWNPGPACRYTPENLWAQICRSQGMQFSAEMVESSLPQLMETQGGANPSGSWEGDPLEVFNRVAADPASFLICMTDTIDSGHCVTPFEIIYNRRFVGYPAFSSDHHLIGVYDSNAPGFLRYIEFNMLTNEFRYSFPPYFEGRGIAAHPMSIWEADQVSMPNPRSTDRLHLIVFGQGAEVTHRDSKGNGWGTSGDEMVDTIPGIKAISSYSGPDGESRNTHAFIPPDIQLEESSAHLREDGDYGLYAAHGGRQLRVTIPNGGAGETDNFTLRRSVTRSGLQLDGVEFVPGAQRADAGFAMGDIPSDSRSLTYRLDGLSLGQGATYLVEMLPPLERNGAPGIQFTNGGKATSLDLTIHLADTVAGSSGEVTFPGLTIPTNATAVVSLPNYPAFDRVTLEMDLDGDGQVDTATLLDSGVPQLDVTFEGKRVAVSYPQRFSGWEMQFSPDLAGPWNVAKLEGKSIRAGLVTALFAPDGAAGFLRLALP